MDRATCWSVTINNPTEADMSPALPAGWTLEGQMETGVEGTQHFQAMLRTPQVRFSAVKKVLPRAHIEVARNKQALAKYVQKEETRAGEYQVMKSSIPTLFEYQETVAAVWNMEEYNRRVNDSIQRLEVPDMDEIAMRYLDDIVASHIEAGMRGVEYIAINPMWRSSWKKFWRSIIKRNASFREEKSCEGKGENPPAPAAAPV